eukprot:EC814002.1.p3 GENE.EC814002.1~~EC814002.1.p3  ORF type:complete len:95 (-),score=3.11 EC814002.1:158-442(-)
MAQRCAEQVVAMNVETTRRKRKCVGCNRAAKSTCTGGKRSSLQKEENNLRDIGTVCTLSSNLQTDKSVQSSVTRVQQLLCIYCTTSKRTPNRAE